ncbi:Integrase/recombinase xerD like protein [Termitomyces sp. T112]|nr:Integrase/recombinase xerD like protein [Termitomyces sp. T112]
MEYLLLRIQQIVATCAPSSPQTLISEIPPHWYEAHANLSPQATFYLWHGLAASTRKTYSTVCFLHINEGLPSDACESETVRRVICGIKRYPRERARNPKQPITLEVLQKLAAAPRDLSIPFEASMYAAFKTAWAGFLHCGEFTLGQNKKLIPATNLTCGSVTLIPSFETLTHIRSDLPASKTDPFQKGVSILIVRAPGGMSTWAVSALHHLFIIDRKPHDAPLFSNPDGSPLSRDAFVGTLEQSLTSCGFDPPKPTGAHPWALRPPPFGRLSGIQFHASGLSVRSSGGLSAISFPGSVQKSKGDQIHSICSH